MKQPMNGLMKSKSFDDLNTPKLAVELLLPFIPTEVKWVWECCDPGNSLISSTLRDNGYKVMCSDITRGYDFLDGKNDENFCDCIITNPPFSLKTAFLKECYRLEKPFALLLPLTAIGGQERNKLFAEHGISIIVPSARIDFTGKGAPWFPVGWFTWKFLEDNTLRFVEI
jgi:hypothetical protein